MGANRGTAKYANFDEEKKKTPSIYLWIRFPKRFASLMNSRFYVNEVRFYSNIKIIKMICYSSIHVEHETNFASNLRRNYKRIWNLLSFSIFYSNEEATLLPTVIGGELSFLIETESFETIIYHATIELSSPKAYKYCINALRHCTTTKCRFHEFLCK